MPVIALIVIFIGMYYVSNKCFDDEDKDQFWGDSSY